MTIVDAGYDLEALADSAAAHVRALAEGSVPPDQRSADTEDASAVDALAAAFASSVAVVSEPTKVRLCLQVCDGYRVLLLMRWLLS